MIGGFGTGIIYVGIIGLMVRWFPDRRGLATGLAAAGYGFGAFFTSFPIDSMIKSSGYQHTLVVWGIIQGIIGVAAALGLRMPPEDYRPAGFDPATVQTEMQSKRSFTPVEMLQNPIFYLLFIMMAMMSTSGLMVVSNVGPFAKRVQGRRRAGARHGGAAAVAHARRASPTASPARSSAGCPTISAARAPWRSPSRSRRWRSSCCSLFLDHPAMFVVLTGLVFFGWGEIFSLFPVDADRHVRAALRRHQLRLPLHRPGRRLDLRRAGGGLSQAETGSWTAVFIVVACLDALTAVLALTVLKQMRRRHFETTN